LVAAAYYVPGENVVERRGLGYSNQDVVLYRTRVVRFEVLCRARPQD